MACSSSCPTQDHETFGACIRAKNLKSAVSIPGNGWDRSVQKDWDSEIAYYRSARAQGVQPSGTTRAQTERALKISEETGSPYQAG